VDERVDWRTSGERIVVIMVGEMMRVSASRHSHVADTVRGGSLTGNSTLEEG
jgi:hypothetical protein